MRKLVNLLSQSPEFWSTLATSFVTVLVTSLVWIVIFAIVSLSQEGGDCEPSDCKCEVEKAEKQGTELWCYDLDIGGPRHTSGWVNHK